MTAITLCTTARTMTSREIAELTGKQHKDVLHDIRKMLEDLGLTSADFSADLPDAYGRPQPAFRLPKRECLILVSGYSVQMRARIIDRWQELESGAAPAVPALPRTFAEALRLAADEMEARQKAEEALALAAPKADLVDRYMDATGTQTFREVAKLLGAKEPAFRAFLAARRVMYQIGGHWVPYAEHITAGRFVIKTGEANGHAFSSTRFTPKGIAWVSSLWRESVGVAA